jgi:hypothetical protein
VIDLNSLRRWVVPAWLFFTCQAPAQTGPSNGLYQITSGLYTECCGFAGTPVRYHLPTLAQSFVRFTVNPQTGLASMVFLGADMQTASITVPCPTAGRYLLSFDYGFVGPDVAFFLVDPGPPPYSLYWHYTVSNSAPTLRIDGTIGSAQQPCPDVPSQFSHSNVVAVLIPPPRLSLLDFSTNQNVRLLLQGNAGQTNVIEASSELLAWIPISTNVMDYSLCPICPFFIFEDAEATNFTRRFYRASEIH